VSAIKAQSNIQTPPASRWRLWIDGCGGYLLLAGVQWSVGGWSQATTADICVRSDWPRSAGSIGRRDGDYFWQGRNSSDVKMLLTSGTPIPVPGSAVMTLNQPSQLSDTAVLSLNAPHRFDQHVDGVVLVQETVLIGSGNECHLRCRDASDRAILKLKENQWYARAGLSGEFHRLDPGHRLMLQSLAMTLETV